MVSDVSASKVKPSGFNLSSVSWQASVLAMAVTEAVNSQVYAYYMNMG